jgi:hypothetical protein
MKREYDLSKGKRSGRSAAAGEGSHHDPAGPGHRGSLLRPGTQAARRNSGTRKESGTVGEKLGQNLAEGGRLAYKRS